MISRKNAPAEELWIWFGPVAPAKKSVVIPAVLDISAENIIVGVEVFSISTFVASSCIALVEAGLSHREAKYSYDHECDILTVNLSRTWHDSVESQPGEMVIGCGENGELIYVKFTNVSGEE